MAHKGHPTQVPNRFPLQWKPLHHGESVSTAVKTVTTQWKRFLRSGNFFSAVNFFYRGVKVATAVETFSPRFFLGGGVQFLFRYHKHTKPVYMTSRRTMVFRSCLIR